MTYYGAKHLADSFRTVRKNTLAIAEEIPEDKYGFKASPDVMSVGEMLAHLAVSPMWQIDVHSRKKMDSVDFAFFGARQQQAKAEEQLLRTKAEIIRALTENGEAFASFLEKLDEATLQSMVTFPPQVGPPKSRFEMLLGPKEHEMHHRGQLMLVQRLLGQVPHLTRARQAMQAQAAGRA